MLLSATALLSANLNPSRQDIQKALEGNICRCTGYNKIIEAIESVRDKK
jgi:carbon-monoxide dehydrogenase small subunit